MERDRKRARATRDKVEDVEEVGVGDIILEDYTTIANRYLERGAKEIDPIQIKQALADGADPNLKIDGEPVIRFIWRTFRQRHFAQPDRATVFEWRQFIGAMSQFPPPLIKHELGGDDWLFYVIRELKYQWPAGVNELILSRVTIDWLDKLLDSNISSVRKNEIFFLWMQNLFTDSRILKFSTHPALSTVMHDVVQNYPVYTIRFLTGIVDSYIEFFQTHKYTQNDSFKKRKVRLCSALPFTEGYSGMDTILKSYLEMLSRTLRVFQSIPFRFWLDFVNIYLYGIKKLDQTDFPFIRDYIIASEVMPIAGHLERVKFLPLFHQDQLVEALSQFQDRLQQLAPICHEDPDVRDAMEEESLTWTKK